MRGCHRVSAWCTSTSLVARECKGGDPELGNLACDQKGKLWLEVNGVGLGLGLHMPVRFTPGFGRVVAQGSRRVLYYKITPEICKIDF